MWSLVFLFMWWGHALTVPQPYPLSDLDRQNLLIPPWSQQNPAGFMQSGYVPPPESEDSEERVMKRERHRESQLLTLAVVLPVIGAGILYLLPRRAKAIREYQADYGER